MNKHATSKPHGFFMIGSDPKQPDHRLRIGFNEFLTVENLEYFERV
jgi:hypothetical protein